MMAAYRRALVWVLRGFTLLVLVVGLSHAYAALMNSSLPGLGATAYAAISAFVATFGVFALAETLAVEEDMSIPTGLAVVLVWVMRIAGILLFVLVLPTLFLTVRSMIESASTGAGLTDLVGSLSFALAMALSPPLLSLGFAELLSRAVMIATAQYAP